MKMNFWTRKTFEFNQSKDKLLVLLLNIPVGNRCEEIYYGLLKARREGKRTLFFRVYHLLPCKFGFRYTNHSILHINSPFNANEKWILSLFGNILLSAFLVHGSLCKRILVAINIRIRNNFFLKRIYLLLALYIKFNPDFTELMYCVCDSLFVPKKIVNKFS